MWFTLSLAEEGFKIVATKDYAAVLYLGTGLAFIVAILTASVITVSLNSWNNIVGNDNVKLWESNTALEGVQKLLREAQLGVLGLLFPSWISRCE